MPLAPKHIVLGLALPLSLFAKGNAQVHATSRPLSVVQPATIAANGAPTPDFSKAASSEQLSHLGVGHSMVVNTVHRLTRVYITNPNVLDSYTASPNQIIVTAKAAGISSVVVWDETGGSQTYLVSSDLDVERLREALKHALPHHAIQVEADENKITLSGETSTDDEAQAALKLAGLYSKEVSNAITVNSSLVRQVSLKVRIVEVDRAKLEQFGFNFFSAGGNNLASTTTTQFPSSLSASLGGASSGSSGTTSTAGGKSVSITNPLNFLFYSAKLNVGATLQDMENRQIAQILAEPTITALSGQKAAFLAGGEFPFPVVQGASGGLTSISIQFRPYGVKLEFTPVVNDDGTIGLKVSPEVSALDYTNAVQINGYTIPALSTRRAETTVVLRSGQTFAISGLLDHRVTDEFGRTPGISSVPILGQLFKSKSVNHSTTELMVVVTPTLVNPITDGTDGGEPVVPVGPVPMLNPKSFDPTLPTVKKPQ